MGLALRAQGKPRGQAAVREGAGDGAGFTEPLEQLATMSFVEKNPQAAITRIERQALLEPKSPGLQYLLGRAYQASGDTKQAEKAYLKAIELNPQAVPAYVSLGRSTASRRSTTARSPSSTRRSRRGPISRRR